jgi:hypothetical protein
MDHEKNEAVDPAAYELQKFIKNKSKASEDLPVWKNQFLSVYTISKQDVCPKPTAEEQIDEPRGNLFGTVNE